MFAWWAIEEEFFLNRTLPMRSSHHLVLAGPHVDQTAVRMPDSGLPQLVIAPDLSNLPPENRAVDLVTGKLYNREDPPPDA